MKALILGASSGFGREFAYQLAVKGHQLVLCSIDEHGLKLAREHIIKNYGCDVEIYAGDLTKKEVVREIVKRYSECDLVINSAGFGVIGDVTEISCEKEQEMLDLNVNALYYLTKMFSMIMIGRKAGGIINVASTASYIPMPNFGMYAATKSFVLSYTLSVSKEAEKYGVRIMAVCPGPTETNFLPKEQYDRIRKKLFDLPVLMSPEKVVKNTLIKFEKRSRVYIPGVLNKVINFVDRFLPTEVILNTIYKLYGYIKEK
ncbi:MAG: SDR family NAD(P)-dependent oxidoreductase [Clostridiaceae bacterium]|nr:SDR family NAD(P)-dependent oxidoreductase [Clostridiaceae bacterium]